MTQKDLELMDKMHKLAHKAAVGYNIDFDEAVKEYSVKIKSINPTERFHSTKVKTLEKALELAVIHLESVIKEENDKVAHVIV